MGLQGKDIAEYVTKHQTLNREERVAWGDRQKMQADVEEKRRADEIQMAEIQAEAEEKKGQMRFKWPKWRLKELNAQAQVGSSAAV